MKYNTFPHVTKSNDELSIHCDNCGKNMIYEKQGVPLSEWNNQMKQFIVRHQMCKPPRIVPETKS